MLRPRRRLVGGILLLVGLILVATTFHYGMKWKSAIDDVAAMQVATMVLPTSIPEAPPENAVETPLPEPPSAPEVDEAIQPTITPELDESINILLLGTDARIGDEVSRTDAIILVRLDAKTKRVSMLSFPRDLWVDIPNHGKNKINAAYPIGEKLGGPSYGAALAKRTVSELTGLPIDNFILINFEGFVTLIDKIGGITIDVPKRIVDNAYPVDEYPGDVRTKQIMFEPGSQVMDGATALIYSRTRHADSDFGRNQRQQQVLLAIFDQIRKQGLLSNLNNVDVYTAALRDHVRTDLTRSEMLQLASIAPSLNANNIQRFSISAKMVNEGSNPYRLELSDTQAFERLLKEMTGEALTAGGSEP